MIKDAVSPWSATDSAELYEVARWGHGYFSVSKEGNLLVHPQRDAQRAIDIKELVDRLKLRGIDLPILIRFDDMIRDRLQEIHAAFSTAIADHVKVDFELRGCPISKAQLVDVVASLLAGRKPATPAHSTCIECKIAGNVCVMVAHGTPCLGPVTHAGCGALCPSYDRGCYGCYGPKETPNAPSLSSRLAELGMDAGAIARVYSTFNSNAEAFRQESERHGAQNDQD